MTNPLFNSPTKITTETTYVGRDPIYRMYRINRRHLYPNGYGASVIRIWHEDKNKEKTFMSYTENSSQWEVGVLKQAGVGGDWTLIKGELNGVNDVNGYRTIREVEEILAKVKAFKGGKNGNKSKGRKVDTSNKR